MAVERLTVSMESGLGEAVRQAAEVDNLNTSAWIAEAARRFLVTRGLSEVVDEWETVHGSFSDV